MTPWAAKNMVAVSALEKIIFWPELRYASDVVIFTDEDSYSCKCLSYLAISCFSLLKCWPRYRIINMYEWRMSSYFHSFIVDQRVYSHSCCLVVCLVGFSSKLCTKNQLVSLLSSKIAEIIPPWSCANREPCVSSECPGGDGSKIPAKFVRLAHTRYHKFQIIRSLDDCSRTKIPHTSEISSAVGTIRKMTACMMNVIPLW